jgi:HEAT repeat protein
MRLAIVSGIVLIATYLVVTAGRANDDKKPDPDEAAQPLERRLSLSCSARTRLDAAVEATEYGRRITTISGKLAALLFDKEEDIRFQAAVALSEIGPSAHHFVSYMSKALKREKVLKIKAKIADALAQIGPLAAEAVPALIEAMEDKDMTVRERVITALGQIGPAAKAAIPVLTAATKDKDSDYAFFATIALKRIEGKK